MLTCLTIALVIAVCALCRLSLYKGFEILDQVFLGLALTVVIIIAQAALASSLSEFNENFFTISLSISLFFIVSLCLLCWWKTREGEETTKSKSTLWFCLIPLLTIVIYLPPSEIVVGGQDPSIYVAAAASLAYNGQAQAPTPSFQHFNKRHRNKLLNLNPKEGSYNSKFNGIYLVNSKQGSLKMDFVRGPSLLLAFGFLVFGQDYGFYANSVYCFIAIYLFFILVRLLLNPSIAFWSTLLLLFCPAEIWFGRATYSEIPSQLFIFFSLINLLLAEKNKAFLSSSIFITLSLIATALAALMRIELALLFFMQLMAIPLILKPTTIQQRCLSILVSSCLLIPIYLVQLDGILTGDIYVKRVKLFYGKEPLTFALIALAFSVIFLWPVIREKLMQLTNKCQRLLCSEAFLSVFSLLVIAFLTWGFVMRVHMWPLEHYSPNANHNAGVLTMNEFIFIRLGLLTGVPILILSFWGLLYFTLEESKIKITRLIIAAIFLAYASKLFFSQANSPILYWACRRYLPVMIPVILFTGTYALTKLSNSKSFFTNKTILSGLYIISFIPLIMIAKPILWYGEMNGARDIVAKLQAKFPAEKTVFFADSSMRHKLQTVQLVGNMEVYQIKDLNNISGERKKLLNIIVKKLKTKHKQVVFLCDKPDKSPYFQSLKTQATKLDAYYWRMDQLFYYYPREKRKRNNGFFYKIAPQGQHKTT